MNNDKHVIMRYRNRKLYSTTLKRYVSLTSDNLEEVTLESLLNNNIPFIVVDHTTGVDITNKTVGSLVNKKLIQNPNLGIEVFNFISNINNGGINENVNS